MDLSLPVLVVDDHATMRRILRALLGQIGFAEVEEAESGAEAYRRLCARSFGLVISDWNMEPMTGLDLLRLLRADARFEALPFIMVTAESQSDHVAAAKGAGVNNYIVKPFNAETLKGKIAQVL